jgi:Putative DNA-binding domain
MQAVITHPAGVAAGIESPAAREQIDVAGEDVDQVITRSRSLDSMGRLQVYGNAYYARLLECLTVEFPTLRHAAGEEAFGAFCVGYLQQHPSTSYTLNALGARLPDYLEETRPPRETANGGPDWPDFLVEVALLERMYYDVFDGPGEEDLPLLQAADLQAIPQASWPNARLATVDSLRLMELQFPVHAYITAVRGGASPPPPEPQPTWLAINRRDYIVRRRPLSRIQFELLRQLQAGRTLADAIQGAIEATDAGVDDLAAQLRQWFEIWTAAGYFRSVEVPGT